MIPEWMLLMDMDLEQREEYLGRKAEMEKWAKIRQPQDHRK